MGNAISIAKRKKKEASGIDCQKDLEVTLSPNSKNLNKEKVIEQHPSSRNVAKDANPMLSLENLNVELSPQDPPLKMLQNDSLSDLNQTEEKRKNYLNLVSMTNSEDFNEEDIIEQHLSSKNFVKCTDAMRYFGDLKIKVPSLHRPSKIAQNNDKDQSKDNFSSIASRTTVIREFFENPDFQMLSTYLNKTFSNTPSLPHIHFIILTLLELSENAASTWREFVSLLNPCYEYIKSWKKKENSERLFQKVISEMLPIIDHAYKTKKGSDIPILSILIHEVKNFLPTLKHLPSADQKKQSQSLQESFESLVHRVNFELKKIERKNESLLYTYLKELSNLLNTSDQRNNISESLTKSRFDKRNFNMILSHSIILGADSGVYVLLNTLSENEKALLLKDSHINHEMMNLVMNEKGKIVIGEGSFGKIRMAMAIISNKKTDTTLIEGNIVCVKKAGSKKNNKEKQEIWNSTWNDYCSIDFLEDSPEIFDMKITEDSTKKLQGYCFQKLLMLPNGDIFKRNEEYQRWVHVKQYFIGIFQLMIRLHERGICMTDLKPANTLYDKRTRTAKVVDLAGAVRSKNLHYCKIKHVKEITPAYTAPELRYNNDLEDAIDLTKCICWTIGYMMERICSKIKEFEGSEFKNNNIIQRIKEEISCLITDLKRDVTNRINLEEGLKRLLEIPDLIKSIDKNFKTYMNILRKSLITEDPKIIETLNLKNDIYTLTNCFNDKLKITTRNPEKYIYDPSTDKSICDLLPAMKKMLENNIGKESKFRKEAVILFGSAGSGKSTILQKMFIEAAQSWEIDDPIPIFMNLAIHYDLKDYWRHLQVSFELEDLEFEDLIKQPLLLFLDSLDESRMDLRVISNISDSLSTYANVNLVKMMITCRTGYLEEEREINRLKENIKFSMRYIIPLDFFFFNEPSNLEQLIALYLCRWEKINENEIEDLVVIYLQKIKEFRLQEIMKTTYMIFMILAIMPKLIKLDSTSSQQNINFRTVYELYLKKNLENEISRSTDEAIKNKNVDWFFKIGILLAESMMLTKKGTNQIGEKEALRFLENPLLTEIGENYNQKHALIENFNIYNILRTLNLNIHFEERPPYEKITISFPHDTIKNYFLTKGFEQKVLSGDEFPQWLSERLVVDDENLVHFMIEAIKSSSSSKLISTSEMGIVSTKKSEDPKVITRAANLITFLVASNYSFYGKDLSDIKIRGANISDGIFNACIFDRADLSNVILNNVKIDRASFKNTNFKDVILDIYPYFEGHSDSVNSVAFSLDGKKVVSGSNDTTVRIWDAESGKELKEYEGHSDSVISVAFSPNGKTLVSGSDDETIRLWDVESGKELQIYEGHIDSVNSVAFSPDGRKLVSGSKDKTVRLWDAESGKEIRKYEGHSESVLSVAFSPNGKKVVSGSDDSTVKTWDLESGKELKSYVGHNGSVNSVAFSPDERKILSGSNDETARLWDIESGKEIKKYEGHSDSVLSVAFSPDGKKLVSGSHDTSVRIWDVESGKNVKKYEGHSSSVCAIAFSSDGKKVVSGSDDTTVRLWDVQNGNEIKKYEGHNDFVNSVAFSPDSKKMVSGSHDETVRLWDVDSGKDLKKYEGHSGYVCAVAFSPDGKKLVSGSDDTTVRLWDLENEKELKIYEGHTISVTSVAFAPDGKKVLSGSYDKTVRLWDVYSGKELTKYEGHDDFVNSVAFSPDGKKVASGSDDTTIRLWDVENGKELKKYEGHSDSVNSIAFSSDGTKLLSGSKDAIIILWDVESGKVLKKYEGHTESVFSVVFSSDSKKIASGSHDATIRLWDIDSGKELKKYEGHSDNVNSIAYSQDGKKVVSGSNDSTIRLWDVENANELKQYEGHSNSMTSFAFSQDGKKVISRITDGTVKLWDVRSGKELKTSDIHNDSVSPVGFFADEKNSACVSDAFVNFNLSCDENKNTFLIISSSATAFSCRDCYNFEDSFNFSERLISLFEQNNENNDL